MTLKISVDGGLWPAHSVTLRSSLDGWHEDVAGRRKRAVLPGGQPSWDFTLGDEWVPGTEYKFVLDCATYMNGNNLTVPDPPADRHFSSTEVVFPATGPRVGGAGASSGLLDRAVAAVVAGPRTWSPAVFFVYDVLFIIALLFFGPFHAWKVQPFKGFHNPYADTIPSIVPWAGALGGVCISIVGVAGYSVASSWHPDQFGYWHLTRPVLGSVFGTTSVLITVLILQSVKNPPSGTAYPTSGQVTLGVISFVVGFREQTFRTLVMRVVDVILGPSADDATATVAFVPAVLDYGSVPAGTPVVKTTYLVNAGQDPIHVDAGAIVASQADVAPTTTALPADLAAGQSLLVTVTWTPAAPAQLSATLTAKLATGLVTCAVQGEAVTPT
jgi:Abnormal spindle-like microcephaly-assoc'd, ASPM-SPD-2-Hydin